jgi:Concanavalin A-like lectin/glucanases superfamily
MLVVISELNHEMGHLDPFGGEMKVSQATGVALVKAGHMDTSALGTPHLKFSLSRRSAYTSIAAFAGMAMATNGAFAQTSDSDIVVWNIDRLDSIGGNPAHVDGQPRIITTRAGKSVEFDGIRDGLFGEKHPLAGFSRFTFEAPVRPDGGEQAQRWFHLAQTDPATGLDATTDPANPTSDKNARFTFVLRVVVGDKVYFESFTHGPTYQSALLDETELHPVGQWYVVTQTYDGVTHRSYVDGTLEMEGLLNYVPQGPGHSTIGIRINHVSPFKGAVMRARFAPRALTPPEFMKVPASLRGGTP